METNKLFVGGIAWSLDWQEIKDAFKEYWEVTFAKVIKDRDTWKSKGYWFVEFSKIEEAVAAKNAMDWAELAWRPIKVDFAVDKKDWE